MIEIRVPATSANLGPGFDTLGLALDLWNTFTVMRAPEMSFSGAEGPATNEVLTPDGQAMILKGAQAVADRLGAKLPPMAFHVKADIPPRRGLGSSATAILAGALAADRILNGDLPRLEILRLTLPIEGHPDNLAAALFGGVVLAYRHSFKGIDVVELPVPPSVLAALAIPEGDVATSASRAVLPESIPIADAVFNIGRAALLGVALSTGRLELFREALMDRVHQPYRTQIVNGLDDILDAAVRSGALGAFLSGSGPTVLALVRKGGSRLVTEGIKTALAAKRIPVETRVLPLSQTGATVKDMDEV